LGEKDMIKKITKASADEMIAFAKQIKEAGMNWLEAQNAIYGPGGRYAALFPTQKDRTAFSKTDQHKEIESILESLPEPPEKVTDKQAGDVSGKILLRLPKSIHAALLIEAKEEGVSLNQLLLSKIALQLRAVA